MLNSIMSRIDEEVTVVKDQFVKCVVGNVYVMCYSNLQTKHKWREFLGLCIKRKNLRGEVRITLRNIVGDVGVEVSRGGKCKDIVSIIDARIYKGSYCKAKLYFLRSKPMTASRVRYR